MALAFVFLSSPPSRAAELLKDVTHSAELLVPGVSCTDPSTCLLSSTNVTSATFQASQNHVTVRFGLNVNADVGSLDAAKLEQAFGEYHLDFAVNPGNYRLEITVRRNGALRRSEDALFPCSGGSVILSDLAAPTFIVNEAPDETLSDLTLPGVSIPLAGGDADAAVPADPQSRILIRSSRLSPVADRFSLTFIMSAFATSAGCEVSARLGAPNLSTTDCEACSYPGVPPRDDLNDGLFVEIAVDDLCGDGATQPGEQCDLANRNGQEGNCCDFDCTIKQQGRVCQPAAGPCDQAEVCSGDNRSCPFDFKMPAGTTCPDDDNPCTTDSCDNVGQCIHTPVPPPCAALCGNEMLDPGEECDLGASHNGQIFSCCTNSCRKKGNGLICDDGIFCNGTETCSDGACSVHTGSCSELGACAICNEQTVECDESRCPSPCGNGQLNAGEDCDLGRLDNGDPRNCCDTSCKFRLNNAICEDGLFCNGIEHCTDGVCGGAAANPCSGLGTCTTCDEANNVCDTSQCPDLCGNGQLDAGEECDLGTGVNGRATNCCDVSCKKRPDNSACTDQVFCNGAEHCSGGVCGGSAGDPCGSRACASCDESANVCDTSACPPGLPDQPTRELLITEIFDGDGDGYATSAGGRVRGTLDLDANADLRFTAADLPRLPRCAADAVLVGGVCVDKYEASVFENPPGSPDLGVHYGVNEVDYPCRSDGSDCPRKMFAHSLAGSTPSVFITWFQAQQACASVGKRLPTNAEWQMAAAGTPDSGNDDDEVTSCNTNSAFAPVGAGTRSACVSKWGIYDMVGNTWEWVAEWVPASTDCPGWGAFSDDTMCLAGASLETTGPGALIRGGAAAFTTEAGPLAIRADFPPSQVSPVFGFRCARAPF